MNSFQKMLNVLFYLFIISPPNSIDLCASQKERKGELSKLPIILVMFIELLIRVSIVLIIATVFESIVGDDFYEIYMFDWVFFIIVAQGTIHSFVYLILLGYCKRKLGQKSSFRVYRYLRNILYSFLPGLATVIPVLMWKLKIEEPPFEDGFVFSVYLLTTLIMIIIGLLEGLLMQRKPRGLDRHLGE